MNSTTLKIQNQQIKEEYPSCGALLLDTLQNRTISVSVPQHAALTNISPKSVEFRTAFHQIEDSSVKLAFDIEKIDSLLNLKLMGVFVLSVSIGTPRF
jgi:hypothetical protein